MHGSAQLEHIDDGVAKALADATSDAERQQQIARWLDASQAAARSFWKHVEHSDGGVLRVGDWTLVADPQKVCAVLRDAARFRVSEYDRRMRATSGRFYLGLDDEAHARDAPTGRIIPSWNYPSVAPSCEQLSQVRETAELATRHTLARVASRTQLARMNDPDSLCRCAYAELIGTVLDACAQRFFGVRAPSAFSLLKWAKEVTWYHFRVYANEAEDRACAQGASAQFRAHVVARIAALPSDDIGGVLARCVREIRDVLGDVSDDDVARNLIGIVTGSLTATAKAFGDGLVSFGGRTGGTLSWPKIEEAADPLRFPRYDAIVAASLAAARRGSPDAVYRIYRGAERHAELGVSPGDKVIVWLGGALQLDRDHLFGVGVHKCPGMDMGKAIMEGMLRALMSLPLKTPATLERVQGELHLAFDGPEALEYHGR